MSRARAARIAVLGALVAALCVGGVRDAGAQLAAPGVYDDSALEQEAMQLLEENKLVTARTKAEEVLATRPYSIVGHYVLGRVLFEAEGSHARAMYHLGRARELYERTWNAEARPAGSPWELHRELLYHTARVAGQMELHEHQLHVLGYHDFLYDPDMLGERAWPLMHLGRFEEARDFATRAANSRNQWQRSAGLNALCAVEGEAQTREPYYEACLGALEAARREVAGRTPGSEDEGGGITVDAYNAAMGAMAALRFQEAEELAREGVRRLEFTPANPWRFLLYLYISQNRMDPALGAVRDMMRWRNRQPAYLRDQSRAEDDAAFATLLLVAGETEVALRAITASIEQPDRRGLTSSDGDTARGNHALLRRVILRTHAEREREEASMSGFGARVHGYFAAMGERLSAWPDDERVAATLTDEERLVATLRPHVQGGIEGFSPWLAGELVDVVGAGVVAVALEEARRRDADAPEVAPYYDAIEAEIELERGDEDRALSLAQQALDALPATEVLLKARLAAVASEAARRKGSSQLSHAFLEQVLQLDPSTVRRMGLVVPVHVRATGGGAAQEAADLLEASPRFRSVGGAFVVEVETVGDGLRACLNGQHGNQLRCAEVYPEPEPDPEAEPPAEAPPAPDDEEEEEEPLTLPQRLSRELHAQAFSARIALSRIDMQSLDGRTTGGSEIVRDQLQGILGGAPPP